MRPIAFVVLSLVASVTLPNAEVKAAACAESLSAKANISELFDCIKAMNREIEQLERRQSRTAIPDRSVLIVNDPGGCPAGWSSVDRAEGRFIVGAHESYEKGGDSDVQRRFIGERGGAERVELTLEEMPKHAHGYSDIFFSEFGSWAPTDSERVKVPDGVGNNSPIDRDNDGWAMTKTAGESESHENMPPYIAFYFCMQSVQKN